LELFKNLNEELFLFVEVRSELIPASNRRHSWILIADFSVADRIAFSSFLLVSVYLRDPFVNTISL
jgi:hypothetical protein